MATKKAKKKAAKKVARKRVAKKTVRRPAKRNASKKQAVKKPGLVVVASPVDPRMVRMTASQAARWEQIAERKMAPYRNPRGVTMTRPLAIAASKDAANSHMRKGRRATWNQADYNVYIRTFDRLWPAERDIVGARRNPRKAAGKTERRNPPIVMSRAEQSLIRKISHLSNQPATATRARQLKTLRGRFTALTAKKNPGSSLAGAGRLYKRFIGKAPRQVTRVRTAHPAAAKGRGGKLPVAKLATLSYLKVKNPALKDGMIAFRGAERPKLLSHASGRQYYFAGGKQKLDGIPATRPNPDNCTATALKRAGLDGLPLNAKLVPLGEVEEIGYFERKKVENFRPVEYYHKLGEENGKRPTLVYDKDHQQMHLVGGDYRTLWNGINN